MKGIGVALALLFAAYLTDQYLANGKYTDAAKRMVTQMRHSTRIKIAVLITALLNIVAKRALQSQDRWERRRQFVCPCPPRAPFGPADPHNERRPNTRLA